VIHLKNLVDWISASLVGLDISYHGGETLQVTNNKRLPGDHENQKVN